MKIRLFVLCVATIIAPVASRAIENVMPANNKIGFTGDDIDIKEAISPSKLIFVGSLTNLGKVDLRGKGTFAYDMAVAVVSKIYLGNVESPVKLNIRVRNNAMVMETAPSLDEPYIFIISQKNNHNYLIKLLPATDDNIAKVKALIAAMPASK
jgi:hypothetical protein